jgi:hypothetical protein
MTELFPPPQAFSGHPPQSSPGSVYSTQSARLPTTESNRPRRKGSFGSASAISSDFGGGGGMFNSSADKTSNGIIYNVIFACFNKLRIFAKCRLKYSEIGQKIDANYLIINKLQN